MTVTNVPPATKTIKAVFRDGVFRPVGEVSLPQGTEVQLQLPYTDEEVDAIMTSRYPKSWGSLSHEAAEEIRKIIDEEFGQIDPNDWL